MENRTWVTLYYRYDRYDRYETVGRGPASPLRLVPSDADGPRWSPLVPPGHRRSPVVPSGPGAGACSHVLCVC